MPPKSSLPSFTPDIRLFGSVDQDMLSEFFRQQAEAEKTSPWSLNSALLAATPTSAGVSPRNSAYGRSGTVAKSILWGKTYVFSAGVTVMAAIPAARRFVTRDCELLIHERKLSKDITLNGSLRSALTLLHDAIAQIESGQRLEREGFAKLVEGTGFSLEQLQEKVFDRDWYVSAHEALKIAW